MSKRSMAVFTALMIGISACPSGAVVMAGQVEEDPAVTAERELDSKGSLKLPDLEELQAAEETQGLLDIGKIRSLQESTDSLTEGIETKKDLLDFLDTEEIKETKDPLDLEAEEAREKAETIHKENAQNKGNTGKAENSEIEEDTEKKENSADEETDEKKTNPEESDLKYLQIPQKLDVVVDPWEMDGRTQIYSEQYVIRNTGENAGTLTLSNLQCTPREGSDVVVKTNQTGIHDNEEKSIYMEMMFGNGEQLVLSQDKTEYQVRLNPGEELSLWFTGEVNEYASADWKNGDIEVSVIYTWDMEESPADTSEKEDSAADSTDRKDRDSIDNPAKKSEKAAKSNEEEAERSANEKKNEELAGGNSEEEIPEENAEETKADPAVSETSGETGGTGNPAMEEAKEKEQDQQPVDPPEKEDSSFGTDGKEEISTAEEAEMHENIEKESLPAGEEKKGSGESEEKEIKVIEIQESKEMEIFIDSWETDEKGQMVSALYRVKNTGDTEGTLTLADLICRPREQSGSNVDITTKSEKLPDENEETIYLEMRSQDQGEGSIVLAPESAEYERLLKPGEEVLIRFIGKKNESIAEKEEDREIAATAVWSWEKKELP